MNLDALTTQIDEVFFMIGAAILLIEIAEIFFKGKPKARTFGEMLVSASTQIPYLFIEAFTTIFGFSFSTLSWRDMVPLSRLLADGA